MDEHRKPMAAMMSNGGFSSRNNGIHSRSRAHDDLWARYSRAKGYTSAQQAVASQDYYDDGTGKAPRYYQLIAINRTIEAIAQGANRLLLVMATGTGKTYTAFQIIWRLWKSGAKKRILFLVDRNILADQTKTNDFKPFGQAMTKITNRKVDKAFEIYLALYQAVTGTDDEQNIYKQFSPDFFDLVIIDECHRGSADEDANWRKVLEYFSAATQIGMTATPKETEAVSNIEYFGDRIYTYSLKQGIEDGFLAPYKVVRIGIDKDLDGWRPEKGKTDKHGQLIEDREYNETDIDRNLILEEAAAHATERHDVHGNATKRHAVQPGACRGRWHPQQTAFAITLCRPLCRGMLAPHHPRRRPRLDAGPLFRQAPKIGHALAEIAGHTFAEIPGHAPPKTPVTPCRIRTP
jgi:type I restriction enzyme R subunit